MGIAGSLWEWERMYPTPESTMEAASLHIASLNRRRLEACKDFAPRALSILQAHDVAVDSPAPDDVLRQCLRLLDADDREGAAVVAALMADLEQSLSEQGLRNARMALQAAIGDEPDPQ